MGEVLTAFFVFLVVVIGGVGAIYANAVQTKKRITARMPISAQVNPTDDLATVLAKSKNHHRVIESVRIFNDLINQDNLVPVLSKQIREAIEAFLADYYKDN